MKQMAQQRLICIELTEQLLDRLLLSVLEKKNDSVRPIIGNISPIKAHRMEICGPSAAGYLHAV